MIKARAFCVLLMAVAALSGCRNPLQRVFDNPVDPGSDDYIGSPSEDGDGDGIGQWEDVDEIVIVSPGNAETVPQPPFVMATNRFNPNLIRRYWIQISTENEGFDGAILFSKDDYTSNECVVPAGVLPTEGTYYARAKVYDGTRWSSEWSEVHSFVLDIAWSVTAGGGSWDCAEGMCVTPGGGVALVGYSKSFGVGDNDMLLCTLGADGAVDWCGSYGGSGDDRAAIVRPSSDGGFLVAGFTRTYGAGNQDLWVLKVSSNGSVVWQKAFGGPGNDWATAIEETSDGGLVVGGCITAGTDKFDYLLLKLASNGEVEWQKGFGGSYDDYLSSVRETSDGGYILAGSSYSFNYYSRVYVIRVSSDGSIVWEKTYDTSSFGYYDWAGSVWPTDDGGFLVGGKTGSYGFNLHGDFWVLRIDGAGEIVWQRVYGGPEDDSIIGNDVIATDSMRLLEDGSLVLTGRTESYGAGNADGLLLRVASDGAVLWCRTYGGALNDWLRCGAETANHEFIVSGYTNSFGAGDYDYWALHVNEDGGCWGFGAPAPIQTIASTATATARSLGSKSCSVTVTDTSCATGSAIPTRHTQAP